MKRLILVGILAALLAAPAMALEIWFEDDFEAYADGTRLRLCAPKWMGGTGPENYVYNDPQGDNAVRLKGNSGTGAASDATNTVSVANLSAGKMQLLRFTLQSDLAYQGNVGNHLTVMLNNEFGNEMGRWYGWSSAVTPRYDGVIGSAVDITDGAIHTFEILYDPATGDAQWLHNGGLQWTYNIGAGQACERVWVQDVARGANDYVWLDDVVIGTPEPATLALLGLGALFLRRRRA